MPIHRRSGRTTALIAFAALALVGAACSSKDDDAATGGSGSTETTAPAADVLGARNEATGTPITIGVVTDGLSSNPDVSPQLATVKATVEYANDHLGGINGHLIKVEDCVTEGTPAGATQCAVEMARADVDAVLVPVSTQDAAIFKGLADTGIPYVTYTSASQDILLKPGAFVLTNPISQIAVPGLVAKDKGIHKVGLIIIDVPAATGPVTQIAAPIFKNLGLELQIIPISPQVADMTPQIQEAIGGGAGVFAVTGTDDFEINAFNALHQLGFDGTIVTTNLSQAIIDGVDGGVEGIVGTGSFTDDPKDEDVQLFDAVLKTYAPDVEPDQLTPGAFAAVLSLVRRLTGVTDAVDADSITAALAGMPKPLKLPLGGGITFQCGAALVAYAPNICSSDALRWTYGPGGERTDFGLIKVPPEVLALG